VAVLNPARWDCPEFRDRHLDLTDGTLAATDQAAAQAHLDHCEECARFDVRVRRGLMVVRNLPSVRPSSDLYSRIMRRLAASPPPTHANERAAPLERRRLAAGMRAR
jgi:hypothetical protein